MNVSEIPQLNQPNTERYSRRYRH